MGSRLVRKLDHAVLGGGFIGSGFEICIHKMRLFSIWANLPVCSCNAQLIPPLSGPEETSTEIDSYIREFLASSVCWR